jgi:hypothetical protein
VAAQWARNINQYRFDEVKAEGRVAVRDVVAKQTKDDDIYKVTASIDGGKGPPSGQKREISSAPEGARRVFYDYTVENDQRKWYASRKR